MTPQELSRQAIAAVERAREAVGELLPAQRSRRKLVAHLDQVEASVTALVEAQGPGWREAKAAWGEAVALWWRLAMVERRVAHGEARKRRGLLPEEDLIQEGYCGLFEAAKRFDPERGVMFKTLAAWWVRASVTRAIERSGRVVVVPAGREQRVSAARRFIEKFAADGHPLGREQLAALVGIDCELLDCLLGATSGTRSLDEMVGEDTPTLLRDLLLTDSWDPEQGLDETERHRRLREAIDGLDARTRDVLLRRMAEETLREIGAQHGISRERARQLEGLAHQAIREALQR